jgi:hypothetical protein
MLAVNRGGADAEGGADEESTSTPPKAKGCTSGWKMGIVKLWGSDEEIEVEDGGERGGRSDGLRNG